jgi:Xaa-Pro aminopeptidase
MMDYEGRLGRARDEMKKRNIGMMFLRYDANLWYLAGIRRQRPHMTDENSYGDYLCGAYIGADDGFTLVAPRMGGGFYQTEAGNKPWIDGVRIIDESEKPGDVLQEVMKQFHLDGRGVALDDRAWVQSQLEFQSVLHSGFSLASEILSPMRMIKDPDEVAAMRKAGEVTDKVYSEVLEFLHEGVTEYDVACEVDHLFAKHGADFPAFATGIRFTKPGEGYPNHVLNGAGRRLERGHSICFDFGACYDGYCSDFGRTAFIGEPPAERSMT